MGQSLSAKHRWRRFVVGCYGLGIGSVPVKDSIKAQKYGGRRLFADGPKDGAWAAETLEGWRR